MGTEIEIPGGTAVLRDELNVRQRAAFQAASVAIPKVYRHAIGALLESAKAQAGPDADDEAIRAAVAGKFDEIEWTEEGFLAMHHVNVVNAWAYLESWTLDRPLPVTPADMGELPIGVFDALLAAVQSRTVDMILEDAGFTPDGAADPDSPTGPSGV